MLFAAIALLATGCSMADTPAPVMAIVTTADVSVSNGRRYVIDTYYAATDDAAVRQTRPNGEINISVVEGERAWTNGSDEDGGDMLRTIVLGHQFHALLMNFDSIAANVHDEGSARVGDWPYGGTLRMTRSGARAEGFVFNFAGAPEIRVTFSEWGIVNGVDTPFHMRIEDGSDTYEYAFTRVERTGSRPDWARRS
jgi:hypothetical protein